MKEEFLMAHRIIEIDSLTYLVVFPVPQREEIETTDFSYPKYIKKLIDKLISLSKEERRSILSTWSMPTEIKSYDTALGRVQIEYEKALRNVSCEDELLDIYTKKMKQIIEEYKKSPQLQREEQLKKKRDEIKSTSQERFTSFLEGKTEIRDLYIYDLREVNLIANLRMFKMIYFSRIDMGIQEELTELELETMTLQEIWTYNKEYLERKQRKERKVKQKFQTNKR